MLSREMTFRTVVELPKMERTMQLGDCFVFLGSCFAEHIGRRFGEYGLPVLCNPTGVLYNPLSLLRVVQGAAGDDSRWPVFQHDGRWYCWLAGTQLSAADEAACRSLMTGVFHALRQALAESAYLFITLGTNVCYRLRESGLVVTNCHKMPAARFEEFSLGVGECTQALLQLVDAARALNPALRVVFTVSPYRYAKYGFHGSQLSKAVLLLGAEDVCRQREMCTYLPIYEIFMDELRDYRFYAEDMVHPAPVAVDYVWHRLVKACMAPQLQAYLTDYEPLRRGQAHRLSDPDSPQSQAFLQRTEALRKSLAEKYDVKGFSHPFPSPPINSH